MTEVCGTANYGEVAGSPVTHRRAPIYVRRDNKYYKNGVELRETELWVDGDDLLDVFGNSTSPGPFTLAVFSFIKDASTTIWIQFGGNGVQVYYKFISWDNCHLMLAFGIQMDAVMLAYCQNSAPKMLTFNDTHTVDKWEHVAITYDGMSERFYRNGVLKGTVNHTIFPFHTKTM